MIKIEQVLKNIETEAEREGWPIIGPIKGAILANAVRQYQPKMILEAGCLVGYSSILMSQYLPRQGKIITLDLDGEIVKLARENFRRAGVDSRVEIKIGPALELIPDLAGSFDLVFLDAAKEEYFRYLKLVEMKLSANAVIVADNVKVFKREMADFLSYVRDGGNYKSQTYDLGFDAVEVSVKIK